MKLAIGVGGDGKMRLFELRVNHDLEEGGGHSARKENTSLSGLLKRKKVPSKSNYFLDSLDIVELTSFTLPISSLSEEVGEEVAPPSPGFLGAELSQIQHREKSQAALFEDTIDRHLAKASPFTIVQKERPRERESAQLKRRKAIKQWVAATEIKSTAVLHTPLQQSPLF